jgi:signal transduction histidine kinase
MPSIVDTIGSVGRWATKGLAGRHFIFDKVNPEISDVFFEFTSDRIILTDSAGRIIRSSKTFDRTFNIAIPEKSPTFVSELLDPKSRYDYQNILSYILREHKPVVNFQLQPNKSIPLASLNLTAATVGPDQQKMPTIFHLFSKTNSDSPPDLDYIEKLTNIGQIAAGMAHELNTPLGVIILSAGLINETTSQSDIAQESASIKSRAEYCSRVVRDLLSYVRREEKIYRPHRLIDTLSKVVGLVSTEAERHAITIHIDPQGGDVSVRCDENQIEQLFFNLTSNAFHAIDKEGTVNISFGRDELLNQVLVRVRDSGKGIKAENLGKIFDPFFTTKPSGQGTGLGLALCKKIVYEHQGTIRAISSVGEGATFEIALPLDVR